MRTVETIVEVGDGGELKINLDLKLEPGQHKVVLLIEEGPGVTFDESLGLLVFDMGVWPDELPLRREDFYGDRCH